MGLAASQQGNDVTVGIWSKRLNRNRRIATEDAYCDGLQFRS